MAGCGAETEANRLITALTTDATFPIPNIDLSGSDFQFPANILNKTPVPLVITDVTTGAVSGPGAFDTLMRGFKAHLQEEWDGGRITGDDYTKAYISLTDSAMNQAVAFVMGKDGAYWQAVATAVQAYTARVALETAKAALAAQQYDAANQKANYALTKMKMSTESSDYCQSEFQLANILPAQHELVKSQKLGQDANNSTANYNLSTMMPAQLTMIKEQTEAQRAQTVDTRLDGAVVTGVLGKQKDLYAQQVVSYQRDAELKAARVWSDAWITQKTIDEGLIAPNQFTNANVDQVLAVIRTKNGL